MVQTITLPSVVVTRSAAEDIVDSANLSAGSGAVKVLARGVASSAQSFADELVQQVISHGYSTMILLGAPRQLTTDVNDSARRAGKLNVVTNADNLVGS